MLITFPPRHLTNPSVCFGLEQRKASISDQPVKTKLEEPEWKTDQPTLASLLVCASVADGVKNS
jgi:hypothetical protein